MENKNGIRSYRDLEVWKIGVRFSADSYTVFSGIRSSEINA
jgi:hypothetical protein